MSYHSITLRPADVLFSTYLRTLRGWKCEKCGRLGKTKNGDTLYKMEASHYFSRKHESTRYDTENVRALCFLCHKDLGGYQPNEQGEYDLWMKQLLGEKGYKNLKIRAFSYCKRDGKLALLFVKQLIQNESKLKHS